MVRSGSIRVGIIMVTALPAEVIGWWVAFGPSAGQLARHHCRSTGADREAQGSSVTRSGSFFCCVETVPYDRRREA